MKNLKKIIRKIKNWLRITKIMILYRILGAERTYKLVMGSAPAAKGNAKFINFVDLDDDTCELQLYGEVCQKRGKDWWTGELDNGNFICEDEVLEEIKKCEGKKNLIMRINSPGGDFYTGIAIYNRIKQLNCNKTAYIDGIAASAASIIAMAADKLVIPAGASMMIHEVKSFMYGYLDELAIDRAQRMLNTCNDQAAEIYSAKTGKSTKEVRKAMQKETWLTGRKAVEEGWADEVLEGDDNAVACLMSSDKKTLMVNGLAFDVSGFGNMPKFPVMSVAHGNFDYRNIMPVNSAMPKNPKMEEGKMEIKNCEDLRKTYPDLVNQAIEEAKAEAVKNAVIAERKRIQEITEIQNQLADSELVKNAMFGDSGMTAQELAYQDVKNRNAAGNDFLKQREDAAKTTNGINSTPNGGQEIPETENNENLTPEQRMMKAAEIGAKDFN